MKKRTWYKEHQHKVKSDKSISAPRKINIVGCRIRHSWKDDLGQITKWKGIVLDRVTVNPSLYLIKYDERDCVYGIELYKDERISDVEVFRNEVTSLKFSDAHLADAIVGKPVEHMFETQGGSKRKWRGLVLALAPMMNTWFYTAYEDDPILYVYELLHDYKEGDLCIIPNLKDPPLADRIPDGFIDGSLVGEQVVNVKEDGSKRTGVVIQQVKAKPSVYFLKFENDSNIYVYDLVQNIS